MTTYAAGAGGSQGERQTTTDALARGLGWLCVGLGVAELVAPGAIERTVGVRRRRRRAASIRAAGACALAAGIGLLSRSWQTDRVGRGAITVGRPLEDVYRFLRDPGNLPRFMGGVRSVEVIDDRRFRCTAEGAAATPVTWDAEIYDEHPGEAFCWRARGVAGVAVAGTVRFDAAPDGRGTEVRLALRSMAGGAIGAALARIFAPVLDLEAAAALRRFKQVMETGEVVCSDASVHGGVHAARPPAERGVEGGA